MLTELDQEITRCQAGLIGHCLNLIRTKRRMKLIRRYWLVRPITHPGLGDLSQPGLLQCGKQTAKAPAHGALSGFTLLILCPAAEHVHH